MQFISVLLDVTKVKYPIYIIYIYIHIYNIHINIYIYVYIYIYIYDQAVIDSETLYIYLVFTANKVLLHFKILVVFAFTLHIY